MATFVLVHGAWHGAWCWRRVESLLRERGHSVFAPTLTGLAERSHLAGPEVDLSTHINDVANLLRWEQLEGVVLCGHSYGGMVVSGVAERVAPQAIASIVFLDAFLPEDGLALIDYNGEEGRRRVAEEGERTGLVSPVPAAAFKVNLEDRDWVDRVCTPQPYRTLTEKAVMSGARERIGLKTYIYASDYAGPSFSRFAAQVRERADWRYAEIAAGHDVMLDAPEELAALLEAAVPASAR